MGDYYRQVSIEGRIIKCILAHRNVNRIHLIDPSMRIYYKMLPILFSFLMEKQRKFEKNEAEFLEKSGSLMPDSVVILNSPSKAKK